MNARCSLFLSSGRRKSEGGGDGAKARSLFGGDKWQTRGSLCGLAAVVRPLVPKHIECLLLPAFIWNFLKEKALSSFVDSLSSAKGLDSGLCSAV